METQNASFNRSIKKISVCGLFTSLAIAISFAENLSGVNTLMPVPGVKLGLANIAVIGAAMCAGAGGAYAVVIARCVITLMFFGNAVGFAISLSGGLLSATAVVLFLKLRIFCGDTGRCTLIGVSASSAFCHAAGQLIAASAAIGSAAVISVAPPICILSTATGIVTGIAANSVYKIVIATSSVRTYVSR